jgi:uncharacterized protein YcbK (DUF882 family)
MTVKTYDVEKQGGRRLNAFLRVSEFASRDGTTKVLISDRLPTALEGIKDRLKKEYGIVVTGVHINSGYRSPARDRAVGGSGSGPHTRGWAADFTMSAGNRLVDSIYILCAAQDIGIKGIERIRDGHSVHIDVERPDQWWAYQTGTVGSYRYITVKDWRASTWGRAAGLAPAASKPPPKKPTAKAPPKTPATKPQAKGCFPIPVRKAIGNGLVSALQSVGSDGTFPARKKIAEANGITGYTGSAVQNGKLYGLLTQGKLKRP